MRWEKEDICLVWSTEDISYILTQKVSLIRPCPGICMAETSLPTRPNKPNNQFDVEHHPSCDKVCKTESRRELHLRSDQNFSSPFVIFFRNDLGERVYIHSFSFRYCLALLRARMKQLCVYLLNASSLKRLFHL